VSSFIELLLPIDKELTSWMHTYVGAAAQPVKRKKTGDTYADVFRLYKASEEKI
jgi:hypothetical protein